MVPVQLLILMVFAPAVATAQVADGPTAPAVSASQTPAPPAQPAAPANDWLTRPGLTGDWNGARTKMHDKGVDVYVAFTQFFTNAPTREETYDFKYGNKLDVKVGADLGRAAWKGLSVNGHVELRSGEGPLFSGVTLIPTNTALLLPEPTETKARLSNLSFTQVLNPHVVASFGRFNTVDLYSQNRPYTGGEGIDRFMNLSFNAPPLDLRTIPPVAEGALFTVMHKGEPVATAGLIESTDEGFFANGATVLWNARLPIKPFTRQGHYVVGGTFSSIVATSTTQNDWIVIPTPNQATLTEQGAWTVNFTFDQTMAVDASDPTKHWGLFGMVGASDSDPSIFQPYFYFGAGGNVLFKGRQRDTFGIGYFYGGLSNSLIESIQPIRLRDEQGGELYYSFKVAEWTAITADLQFVDPFALGSKSRTFFSVRWKIVF